VATLPVAPPAVVVLLSRYEQALGSAFGEGDIICGRRASVRDDDLLLHRVARIGPVVVPTFVFPASVRNRLDDGGYSRSARIVDRGCAIVAVVVRERGGVVSVRF